MLAAHNSDLGLSFYNDRIKEVVDAGIVVEPFTYVPIRAGHMELVGGNALVFGKITEGYDVIEPDVTIVVTYTDVSLDNPIVDLVVAFGTFPSTYIYYNLGQDGLISPIPVNKSIWDSVNGQSWRTINGVVVIVLPEKIIEGSAYSISVLNLVEGLNYTVSYTANPGDTPAMVKTALVNEIIAAGQGAEINHDYDIAWPARIYFYERSLQVMDFPVKDTSDVNTVYKDFSITAYILSLGLTIKYPQLKCGAVHSFGIVYKDRAGRTCSVVKNDNMDVYLPFYSESVVGGGNGLQSTINLKFKIYHEPPFIINEQKEREYWAKSYEIVYFGNVSMKYYLQIRASSITLIPNSNGNRFAVNIVDTETWTLTQNNRWKNPPYVWEEGDRMRLVGTIDAATGYGAAIGADLIYDYEIEATGTQYNEEAIGGDYLIIQAVDRPTPFEGAVNIIVEIYRPNKGLDQTVAYGTGMVFEIGTDANGNQYHKGDVDQDLLNDTPAEVNNTANDCWKFFRLNYKQVGSTQTGVIQPFWAESIFPSDWWANQIVSNKLTSSGFPFLDDLSQRQTILHERIRHGGFLITGTRTNNIAHFTFDDFDDLPKKNGDITGLREVGFTLKVIQMYKETSIYINRIQTFNPDGTEQFTLTDKFLAEQRPMETDYGCQHPDSVTVNGRNLYYWDNSQGAFIRSAPNGQVALSGPEYKMSRWFKDLARWIQTSGGAQALVVNIGVNNDFEEIWATFRMGEEIMGVIFSEKRGRFISEIDQITESYIHLGNFFAHLYNQRIWIMNVNEGQDYLSWAGTPVYAEIEVVSNVESAKNKVFNAIAVIADHLMESLARFVSIPAEASAAGELMETNVPVFERREGLYFGKIMKDENSKGTFSSTLNRKLNGRDMRGRYCFVKLQTSEHDEKVRIDSITVFSTPSERNI